MFWIGLVVGVMVGACIGLLAASLCRSAAVADGRGGGAW